jgi:transcriptional regulator with XRE-family HTH domain
VPLDGEKVRSHRVAAKLTQREAADAAGVSSQMWSDVENGRRDNLTITTLESVAEALKVSPCDLLTPAKRKAK